MELFSVVGKLLLDSSGFDKGVSAADKSGQGLASKLESSFSKIKKFAAGALSVAAIKKGIDSVMQLAAETSAAGDKIDKQSQALGLSRKAYQEWDYILGQSGASIDSMGISMKTLNGLILNAAAGSEESKDAFAQLGLSIHEIETLSMEDQFESVVRAFQKLPPGAQKSALAVQLFGRNGQQLLPLLNSSATSIDELRERAEQLGIIMSDDAVNASVAYNDAMDDLTRTFNGMKYAIGSQLLPVLTRGVTNITNYAGKIKKAYDAEGFKGVWNTLVQDVKSIKWPTWEQVGNAIKIGWNGIVNGVKGLAKLVFGENVDGSVKWPDVETLSASFTEWWTGTALPALQTAMVWTLKLFDVPQESAEAIASTVGTWWSGVVETVQNALVWFIKLPSVPPHEAGAELKANIEAWWKAIQETVSSAVKLILGVPDIQDESGEATQQKIKEWWKEKVASTLKSLLDFTLGLFGLPSVDEQVEKIQAWWEGVKAKVGQLVLNIGVKTLFGYDPSKGETWSESVKTTNAKFGIQGVDITQYDWDDQHAKGSWSIPYDDYLARLHRGEMVLTASQARRYRDGEGSSFDMDALVSNIVSAIQSGMQGVTVNSYLSGRSISDDVNSRTIRQLKARRFAT